MLAGVLQPAQGDRSAPVVSDHDHVAAEFEHVGERHQIGDAIAQSTQVTGALRETHLELIRGDHPHIVGHRGSQMAPR